MESFATPYPVLFHDGENEHDKGHVGVHSVLTFKRFQALMAQKTGIPSNQLSAVFVCRRTVNSMEKRQKLPINENTNFNIILNQHNPSRERDCHFLVSMKKSKKERKGIISSARKRSAEADTENADDEDSASSTSCGDSPADERPKVVADFADETATISSGDKSPRSNSRGELPSSLAQVSGPAPTAFYDQPKRVAGNTMTSTSSAPSPNSANLTANPQRFLTGLNEKETERAPATSWNGRGPPTESIIGGARFLAALNPMSASQAGLMMTKMGRQAYHPENAERQQEMLLLANASGGAGAEAEAGERALRSLQHDNDRMEMERHGRKSSASVQIAGPENSAFRANSQYVATGAGQHLPSRYPSGFDLLRHDKVNDALAQPRKQQLQVASAIKPPSASGGGATAAAILTNLGAVPVGSSLTLLQRSSAGMSLSTNYPCTTMPLTPSSSTIGAFMPRVSSTSSLIAAPGSANGAAGLGARQRFSSHISHLPPQQSQHAATNFSGVLGPMELSKLNGMIRGLVERDVRGETVTICKVCCHSREKNASLPDFHWCADDTIITGFSGPSPAGPIGRPVKRHVEAAA